MKEQEILAGYPVLLSSNEPAYAQKALYSFPLRQGVPGKLLGYYGSREHEFNQFRAMRMDPHGLKKPRIVTIMRAGPKPVPTIRILLNRNSTQNYEQLIKDMSDAFGAKWKENKIQKMFTIKGREVQGVNDLFRDEVFIGVGSETLSLENVEVILNELYPDNNYYVNNLMRYWDKDKTRQRPGRKAKVVKEKKKAGNEDGHMDSGLGSEDGNKTDGTQQQLPQEGGKANAETNETDLVLRLEFEKKKQQEEKSKNRLRKRLKKQLVGNENLPPMAEEPPKRLLTPLSERPNAIKNRRHSKRDISENQSNVTRRTSISQKTEEHQEAKGSPLIQVNTSKDKKPAQLADSSRDSKDQNDAANQQSTDAPSTSVNKAEDIVRENGKVSQSENVKESENEEITQPENNKVIDVNEDKKDKNNAEEQSNLTVPDKREKKSEVVPSSEPSPRVDNKQETNQQNHLKAIKRDDELKVKKRTKEKPLIVQKSKFERQISSVKHVQEKYELGKILGDGNFAVVRQSKLNSTGQEFAIKVVDKSKLKGKENMIENEIALMKMCDHPNIVKLYEEFETKDEIYLVMEFVRVCRHIYIWHNTHTHSLTIYPC